MVGRRERAVGRYAEVLTLDHYLEVLKTKPGGLPGAATLAQAKASRAFTISHQAGGARLGPCCAAGLVGGFRCGMGRV